MSFELEKFRGMKTRHTCPACHFRLCFVRYVTTTGGNYLSTDVGRCNRESKCGYHFTPKQFFAASPTNAKDRKNGLTAEPHTRGKSNESKEFDYIPFESFKATLGNYERNDFVRFLIDLFPGCISEIQAVFKMYFVGTYQSYTCFPSIDCAGRVCRAKLIRFNRATGKRLKGVFDTSSLPAKLKLKTDFNYRQIFFGEHLLKKFPEKAICIVESEKTAVIASLCFPGFVWLGSNSKTWLKAERLKRLGKRQIILYPDADGFDLWQSVAFEASGQGRSIKVSNLIEKGATAAQKAAGYDLADYLIAESRAINQYNDFVDAHNSALAACPDKTDT